MRPDCPLVADSGDSQFFPKAADGKDGGVARDSYAVKSRRSAAF